MIVAPLAAGVVSVAKLLSACVDANLRGCEVIRDYRRKTGTVTGTLKEAGDAKSVLTQADLDAQRTIASCLRSWVDDGLRVVGEEDGDPSLAAVDGDSDIDTNTEKSVEGILLDLLKQGGGCDRTCFDVPIGELTVFIDPLDGTREFVEGRLENVGCLVGIARNGRAVAGAVGLPFPDGGTGEDAAAPRVHYALLRENGDGGHIVGTHPPLPNEDERNDGSADSKEAMVVLTGDSKDPVLVTATKKALSFAENVSSSVLDATPPEHRIVGGTAAKLVSVALGDAKDAVSVLHFKTSLWDTCATEALIRARGGRVTDLFGSPLEHRPDKREFPDGGNTNILGVVASSGGERARGLHEKLTAAMRGDSQSVKRLAGGWMGSIPDDFQPQALDVARDLDGYPLDVSKLEKQLGGGGEKGPFLRGYSVPETGAVRQMMSNGCRLILDWEGENEDGATQPPATAFYKRVVMSDSADSRSKLQNAPHKLIRDVRSYQVETAFLTSQACQDGLIREAGVKVNKAYSSDLRPAAEGSGPEEQIKSRFGILVEDFGAKDGWKQEWLLTERSSKAALKAFADMHGYFFCGSNFWKRDGGMLGEELERAVWPNGGYMQPNLQGLDQLENVAAGWAARLPTFQSDLETVAQLKHVDLFDLGERLQAIAKHVGERAHPFAEGMDCTSESLRQYRTLIHGDPKQANIFLRQKDSGGKNDVELEVGLIDFQWCGFGLAATDVAHFICAAIEPGCLCFDGTKEKEFLDYYYQCLVEALVRHGVALSEDEVRVNVFPRGVFQEQYDTAVLDICRMVFSYAWKRWKPESKPTPSSLDL